MSFIRFCHFPSFKARMVISHLSSSSLTTTTSWSSSRRFARSRFKKYHTKHAWLFRSLHHVGAPVGFLWWRVIVLMNRLKIYSATYQHHCAMHYYLFSSKVWGLVSEEVVVALLQMRWDLERHYRWVIYKASWILMNDTVLIFSSIDYRNHKRIDH